MRRLLPLWLLGACSLAPAQFPPGLVLPPRQPGAPTGSQLLGHLRGLSLTDRETLLWHELAAGNVPPFLRTLVPVTTQATIQGQPRTATFWCSRDYLGLGADNDWFRMPMTPTLAQQLADRLDCALPTRRMVDAIWAQAPVRVAPFPYNPNVYDILSVELFHQHHLQIESQRGGQSQTLLTGGQKKDVVASALIGSWPGRVCIYGWHQLNGTPIQPLSKVHTQSHVDYSHGIRLVARTCEVDGALTTVDAVLADPVLHPLLSDEGPFHSWRYPSGTAASFPVTDTFPTAGPQRAWMPKFAAPTSVPTTPPPPSGDATALRVMDPSGGTDSIRLAAGLVADVAVQAELLCEHRPQLAADGFERLGIFVRDQANGAFDGTQSQAGACYALTWDSHDGRVRCLRVQNGALTDLLPMPRWVPGTAWRRFRLDAVGTGLQFRLDGELLLQTNDAAFARGGFGIGTHEYFTTNANQRGARVDAAWADVPGAFALRLRPGPAPGDLRLERSRGVPGDLSFTALTLLPGAFPHGWFFGLDPALADLLAQFTSGHPAFVGTLDAGGEHSFATTGVPIGQALFAVALDLDPTLRHWQASAPVAVVTR
ncbi:MAG: hypothetical protein FJ265_01700 [Planctomycetes bacterium]|nr:hypothetical protein [Planctomycetota bacterium]